MKQAFLESEKVLKNIIVEALIISINPLQFKN